MFALNIFQNVDYIRIANIYPLNFETGLQVTNVLFNILSIV